MPILANFGKRIFLFLNQGHADSVPILIAHFKTLGILQFQFHNGEVIFKVVVALNLLNALGKQVKRLGAAGLNGFEDLDKVVQVQHSVGVCQFDFVSAVAEYIKRAVFRDGNPLRREIGVFHGSHHHSLGSELMVFSKAFGVCKDQHRGRMAGAPVGKMAAGFVEDAIPHGEIHVVVRLHREGGVEAGQHLAWFFEIHVGQGS